LRAIIEALVSNYMDRNYVLEALVVDDAPLSNFDGLQIIPIDLLEQGARKTVQFMLDLLRSPNADPLYRCKLMVVGFAEIGKSTLIDCLFPLIGSLLFVEKNGGEWIPYMFELQGNVLKRYQQDLSLSKMKKTTPLETIMLTKEWKIETIQDFDAVGIELTGPKGECYQIFADDGPIDEWKQRFIDIHNRDRTHGIDIKEVVYDDDNTQKYFRDKAEDKSQLQLSVWDFAGQHDYYNNHQHFLSARSLFLVLWNVKELYPGKDEDEDEARLSTHGEPARKKGLASLKFWFSSLDFHLTKKKTVETDRDFYSIVVVGTHIDQLSVEERGNFGERKKEVETIAKSFGLKMSEYVEVSCVDELTDIPLLQTVVSAEVLQLKCMGERIPKSYLTVETLAKVLNADAEHKKYPVVDIDRFVQKLNGNLDLVQRALTLLAMGENVPTLRMTKNCRVC